VFSVKGGLENLVSALIREIGPENILCNSRISRVEPVLDEHRQQSPAPGQERQGQSTDSSGVETVAPGAGAHGQQAGEPSGGYRLQITTDDAEYRIHVPVVISTVGAYALEWLFPFIPRQQSKIIAGLDYARVVQVVLGFTSWRGLNLKAFGGLVPSRENRRILGVLFPSSFLSDRAPAGGALLNVFLGGSRHPEYHDMPDKDILDVVQQELTEMFCLPQWSPDLVRVFRYRHAIPQYTANAGERIDTIRQVQEQHPGLILAGNIHEGIGMADRVAQAVRIAKEVAELT
jgi:protoporphyrinogen/coproporphyrinogen III oxidase